MSFPHSMTDRANTCSIDDPFDRGHHVPPGLPSGSNSERMALSASARFTGARQTDETMAREQWVRVKELFETAAQLLADQRARYVEVAASATRRCVAMSTRCSPHTKPP